MLVVDESGQASGDCFMGALRHGELTIEWTDRQEELIRQFRETPRRQLHKMSEGTRKLIIELSNDGWTTGEIATLLGYARDTIRVAVKKAKAF